MTSVAYAAVRRNDLPPLDLKPTVTDDNDRLTVGGREIHRRTGWGASLSNAVAVLAMIGTDAVEGSR